MKLQNLYIENFRHINNTSIEFGDKITVISGQNGTGKSSILGLVAQLCKYKGGNKQLNGNKFIEDYKKIFNFCKTNDFNNNYKLIFNYIDDGTSKNKTLSTRLTSITGKNKPRYRVDYNRNSKLEKSALNYPIVYLGLRRLIPLATENLLKKHTIELSTSEK
jgi:recombinational DNA repair ATPase RecF